MNGKAELTLEQLRYLEKFHCFAAENHRLAAKENGSAYSLGFCHGAQAAHENAAHMLAAAIAEAEHVDPLNGWTRVEDDLPDFGSPVPCAHRSITGVAYAMLHRGELHGGWGWFDVHGNKETMAITHWRELPPLPESAKE